MADPDPDALDRAFHALADPTRRAIVARLVSGPTSVGALARPLPMSLAGVGQHVRVLEAGGLVRTEKTGRTRICVLQPQALGAIEAWVADHRIRWEGALDRLGDVLDALDDEEDPR